jgi:hypothetical protein
VVAVVVVVIVVVVVVAVVVVVVAVVVVILVVTAVAVAVPAVIPHFTTSNSHSSIPYNSSQLTSSQVAVKQAPVTKTVAISFGGSAVNL